MIVDNLMMKQQEQTTVMMTMIMIYDDDYGPSPSLSIGPIRYKRRDKVEKSV